MQAQQQAQNAPKDPAKHSARRSRKSTAAKYYTPYLVTVYIKEAPLFYLTYWCAKDPRVAFKGADGVLFAEARQKKHRALQMQFGSVAQLEASFGRFAACKAELRLVETNSHVLEVVAQQGVDMASMALKLTNAAPAARVQLGKSVFLCTESADQLETLKHALLRFKNDVRGIAHIYRAQAPFALQSASEELRVMPVAYVHSESVSSPKMESVRIGVQ